MHTILGLLGVAIFIPCVVALAAALTWLVVKVSPPPKPPPPDQTETSG